MTLPPGQPPPLDEARRNADSAARARVLLAASAGKDRISSPWLTIEEARREIKVGPKLLYREIKSGRLRAARLGGRSGAIRIHRDWISAWLEASATPIEIGRPR